VTLRQIYSVIFLTLAFTFTGLNSKSQENFYQPENIQEIRIVFDEPNWRDLMDSLFMNFGEDGRLGATVYINGNPFYDAAVRFKGFSSYDSSQVKNPFNIDLNSGHTWQQYQGFQKLKLSNVIHDPSFVREVLAYEIARNYMPAPKANFAMVYVNDTLQGLYTNVEAVDKNFVGKHFSSDGNTFFKGNPEELEYPFGQNSNLAYTHGSEPSGYMPYYKLESSSCWNKIFHFIDVLNNDTTHLPDVLNTDRALWMHAFNYSLINLDSYIGYAQNYYMYEDDNGCFNPILWDLNMSFGSFRETDGISLSLTIDKIKKLNPLQHLGSGAFTPRPLMKNLFLNSTYKLMYLAHLRTIMEEQFESGNYYARAQQLQSIIDAAVQLDSNKFYSYADFQLNIDTTTGPFSDQYPGIKNLMEARMAYLDTFPGIQGAPLLAQQQIQPAKPALNQWCQINCKVQDASEVYLFYRTSSSARFVSVPMFDDGAHCDYFASDSIYGTTIYSDGDILQYYFYAQNDSAGRFLPERAAYVFFTVYPKVNEGALVINEIKLQSDASITDENAEPEPWIEFYNASDETLQLNNLKLFQSERKVFEFPDTLLAPGKYLMVWADEDSTQSGLHTCDYVHTDTPLMLGYDSLSWIDSLVCPWSVDFLSYGSYPNGSRMRTILQPSFAAKNYKAVVESGTMNVFPNPATDKLYITIAPTSGYEYFEIINMQMQSQMAFTFKGVIDYEPLPSIGSYIIPMSADFVEVDVSKLEAGMYILTMYNQGRSESRKFLIVR